MPHVIYLHSSLTITRLDRRGDGLSVRQLLSATRTDVVLALILAASSTCHCWWSPPRASTVARHGHAAGRARVVTSELGAGVALLFAVALLGSGTRLDLGRQRRRARS